MHDRLSSGCLVSITIRAVIPVASFCFHNLESCFFLSKHSIKFYTCYPVLTNGTDSTTETLVICICPCKRTWLKTTVWFHCARVIRLGIMDAPGIFRVREQQHSWHRYPLVYPVYWLTLASKYTFNSSLSVSENANVKRVNIYIKSSRSFSPTCETLNYFTQRNLK